MARSRQQDSKGRGGGGGGGPGRGGLSASHCCDVPRAPGAACHACGTTAMGGGISWQGAGGGVAAVWRGCWRRRRSCCCCWGASLPPGEEGRRAVVLRIHCCKWLEVGCLGGAALAGTCREGRHQMHGQGGWMQVLTRLPSHRRSCRNADSTCAARTQGQPRAPANLARSQSHAEMTASNTVSNATAARPASGASTSIARSFKWSGRQCAHTTPATTTRMPEGCGGGGGHGDWGPARAALAGELPVGESACPACLSAAVCHAALPAPSQHLPRPAARQACRPKRGGLPCSLARPVPAPTPPCPSASPADLNPSPPHL